MRTSYLLREEAWREVFGLFALTLAFGLAACSNNDSPEETDKPKDTPVESIEMPQTEMEIGQTGEEQSFDIHFSPAGAKVKELKAESSNPEIATVTAKLYNKADKEEKAQLSRAASSEGYDSAEITVTPLADGEVNITLNADGVTSTFKVTVKMPKKTFVIQTGEMKDISYNRATATIELNLEKLPFTLEELEQGRADVGVIFSSTHKDELDNDHFEDYGLWHYSSKDGDLESGIQEVELGDNMRLKSGTTYYYRAYIMYPLDSEPTVYYGDIKQFATLTEKEISTEQIVDLGLSVKWAGWNIGASKPEEIGAYYAWGETEEHEGNVFGEAAYDRSLLTKYTVGGKTRLEAADDVAQVKWGSKWRIPTLDEMNELKKLCDCSIVTYNGVRGYKFIGKNGNTIFIPFGGLYANSTKIEESDAILWTSDLSKVEGEDNWAYLLWKNFRDSGSILPTGEVFDVRAYRWNGCTVRAVYVGD